MNKKWISLLAGGTLIVVMIGTSILIKENRELENSINQIQQVLKDKDRELKNITEELELSNQQIIEKDTDIHFLKEERKLLLNEIEELKKKINSSNVKVSFNQSNLKSNSGVDAKRLNKVLEGTGLSGLGSVYVDAEKTYGVNAIFLTALTAQESGWGNSNRAKTQNNLSGYAVYSSSSAGKTFSSKSESIYATAKLLANEYLNTGGKCYKGIDIFAVNTSYCPTGNYDWANKITSIAHDLVQEINSL